MAGRYLRGQVDIGGQKFDFGSGSNTKQHIPYGSYPITPNAIGPWGRAHGAIGINNNAIYDKELGRSRLGIEFHAASNDKLLSAGCMAIAGKQWPQFKAQVLAMIGKHGSAVLHVGPGGAQVTPGNNGRPSPGVTQAPVAQNPQDTVAHQSVAFRQQFGPMLERTFPTPGNAASVAPTATPTASPAPVPVGAGHNAVMARGGGGMPGQAEVERYITDAARARGVDPNIAVRVYRSEGAQGYRGDHGSSFGPYQLHYGGVARGGNRVPGLGDEFTRRTGLDARNPATWQRQVDFSLDRAKKDGWGAWHGWKGSERAGLNGPATGPAPVPTPPARPSDLQNPNLGRNLSGGDRFTQDAPMPAPRPTILDRINPVSSAQAAESQRPLPPSSTIPRMNPADPSGPLLPARAEQAPTPAPVQAAPATPTQRAEPRVSPAAGSFSESADRMRQMRYDQPPMQDPTLEKLGFQARPDGIVTAPKIDQFKLSNLGLAPTRFMFEETPIRAGMDTMGPQPLNDSRGPVQLPPIDVGRVSQGPGNGYQPLTPQLAPSVGPFVPDQPPPMVTPLTQETPPSITPETYADPGPSFEPDPGPSMGDSMPMVGGEGDGGGGMGGMLSGLMDALSNLGGGGEGGGGGSQPAPVNMTGGMHGAASIPEFPSAAAMTAPTIAQKGQMAGQIMPQLGPMAPMFNVKQIGQAAQAVQADTGQAALPTKRLFT